jgi:hypothetical protein
MPLKRSAPGHIVSTPDSYDVRLWSGMGGIVGAGTRLKANSKFTSAIDAIRSAAQQAVLDPAELSKGLEESPAADARDELARRVALRTPFSLDAALPIVAKALAESSDDVSRAAQQISGQLAETTFWFNRREAAQKLADSVMDLGNATLATIEKSSRWTLLSIAAVLGFLMIVAPYALLIIKGRFAETTPEYLVTSLSGSVVVVAGLAGIIMSDRGTREAVKEVQKDAKDAVEAVMDAMR